MHFIVACTSDDPRYIDLVSSQADLKISDTAPFAIPLAREAKYKGALLKSYTANHPIFGDKTFISGKESAFAMTGVPLCDLGRRYDLSDLTERFDSKGATEFWGEMGGTYSIVRVSDGAVVAICDGCGKNPLFIKRESRGVIISNSPRLLAVLGDSVSDWRYEGNAAVAMVVNSQIWGPQTLFDNVHLVEPRYGVRSNGSVAHYFELGSTSLRHFGSVPAMGPRQYSEASAALTGSFKAIGYLMAGKKLTLGLSGGKDSRIMAAYAINAGLNVHIFTSGLPKSPEFGVAQAVASTLGTETEIRESDPNTRPVGENVDVFRNQVGRYDAMLLPVAGIKRAHRGEPIVEITGFGGEMYRGGISKQFVDKPIKNWDDAAQRWQSYHVKADLIGVAKNETVARYNKSQSNWVFSVKHDAIPLGALPELFFKQYRVPMHQGLAMTAQAAKVNIDPLVHPKIQEIHNSIGTFAGATEMTHASLLWHISPALLKIPFLKDRWHPLLQQKFNNFELASTPVAAGTTDKFIRPMPWQFFTDNLEQVKEISHLPESRAIYELIDREKWLAWVERGDGILSTAHANQAFSIFGALLRVNNLHSMPVDGG